MMLAGLLLMGGLVSFVYFFMSISLFVSLSNAYLVKDGDNKEVLEQIADVASAAFGVGVLGSFLTVAGIMLLCYG